jgi:hypothetical protein
LPEDKVNDVTNYPPLTSLSGKTFDNAKLMVAHSTRILRPGVPKIPVLPQPSQKETS